MEMQLQTEYAASEDMEARAQEAALLVRAAAQLRECQDIWGSDGYENRLGEALRFNQSLWTLFQSELTSRENPLPVNLRRDLLNLSWFVDKRTFETLAAPKRESLDVLININRQIAEGLAGQAQA